MWNGCIVVRRVGSHGFAYELDHLSRSRHVPRVIFSDTELSAHQSIVHGFTSTVDGAGEPLNLGVGSTEPDWGRAAHALGAPHMGVAFVSQVHGDGVLWAENPGLIGEADALLSRTPGLLVAVRTADCVPILVVGKSVVGAIHAGWRGLAAGVIPAAISELADDGPLYAVVGPAICVECYEVGEEVVDGISRWIHPNEFVRRHNEKAHVDGGAAAVAQLRSAGVQRVSRIVACTRCDERLWSHRQQGPAAGRQAGIVGLRC